MNVSVRQATRELSRLINLAFYGREHITISSRGKPKAVLMSVAEYDRLGSGRAGPDAVALSEARLLRDSFAARYGTIDVDLVRASRDEAPADGDSVLSDAEDEVGGRR